MKDVTGLCVLVLSLLLGGTGGTDPDSGYCIGTRCFTVFTEPSNFTTARDQCTAQGGHLMTVRSTVSNDVLQILLGNLMGRFWIGLHLQTGCPDPAAELRGFQWVTGDQETDFSKWQQSFNSSCSSPPPPRCVSVSSEDEFTWTQEPCGEPVAGFLCEYGFTNPCESLTAEQGESVSYRIPLGFESEDALSLPPGTTAVRMPAETKYVCFSEQWLQAPWSCEIEEGGCEHKCAVDQDNQPACYCPSGRAVHPVNRVTCEETPEDDPCLSLRCEHFCHRDGDSYACMCNQGFKLARDGRACVDFNDCTDERQCPGDNSVCVNNVGGFQCVCEDGYKMSNGRCIDVDECASAPCEHMCDNSPGSYRCSCYDGYKEDPKTPNKCVLHCGLDECPAECDPNDRFQCYCPEGYIAEERTDHTVCIDMDECSFFYCDQNCRNTFGSYVCACSPGYTLVGQYRCTKNEDDTETDGGMDGSGASPSPGPSIPTSATSGVPHPDPDPDPTRQPSSGVSVGGLVGIIVCTVCFIVFLVFLVHHIFNGKGKMESSKAPEEEAHGLEHVKSDE